MPAQIESPCRSTTTSSSFDLGDRQQSKISSKRRRTTKYASDHNALDLQDGKPTLSGYRLTGLSDRVFEPHAFADLIADECEWRGVPHGHLWWKRTPS